MPQLSRRSSAAGAVVGEAAATRRGVGGKAEGDWRVGLEMSGLFTLCTQSFLVHVKKKRCWARVD